MLKYFFFSATNIVKDSNQSKLMYSGYEIVFDGTNSWSFRDDFNRNATIFGVDNSLLIYIDNCKK